MKRRDFLRAISLLGLSPGLSSCFSSIPQTLYPVADFGNLTVLHITDCHAQLLPVYYRELSVNLGDGSSSAQPPYLAGQEFLKFFGIKRGSREAYAFTHFDFTELATVYGKMGGFAHLATLIKQIRQTSVHGNVLLLDGGDTWQGSATALWTQGSVMLAVCNLLGVDVMTGHWEFTYGDTQVLANIKQFNGDFVAQNVALTDEAQFALGADSSTVFKPYVIKEFGDARLAIIGQAYPYTPIANPKRFIPDWQFGIQEQRLQQIVNEIRQNKSADVIILLSHNGMGIDLKLASRVVGIDVILGGHTHDALPKPIWVNNSKGKTCVTNAGSHGKFLAALDLDIRNNRLHDLRYRLLPVFSNLIEPDEEMQRLISALRKPYKEILEQPLAVTDTLLYRRDTYLGTFDKLLLDALIKVNDAEISLSPGFRWGSALLPGQTITFEDVMNHTAITYPNTLRRNLSGIEIKNVLEDTADNLFNKDPYYQQGGDMVRAGGVTYHCLPNAEFGQRISQIRLSNGELLDASKVYPVASWASVSQLAEGKAMADVLAEYLKLQM
jgi:S-sulfosulfanyl-L-cysteine sulfohydrolase